MKSITIRDENKTLGQIQKLAGIVGIGNDAKKVIKDGMVKVNGEVETRRGKKLRSGDQVEFEKDIYVVHADQ